MIRCITSCLTDFGSLRWCFLLMQFFTNLFSVLGSGGTVERGHSGEYIVLVQYMTYGTSYGVRKLIALLPQQNCLPLGAEHPTVLSRCSFYCRAVGYCVYGTLSASPFADG